MTVNITFSKNSSYLTELINSFVESAPVVTLSDCIPTEWVQAGFCNDHGILQFNTHNISEVIPSKLLDPLLDKEVDIENEKIPIRHYVDKLSETFSTFSKKVYLRGSYATYLVGLGRQLKLLINYYIKLHPETEPLMAAGFAKLNLHQKRTTEPDDIDFAISFKHSIDKVEGIKKQFILLNSELGNVPFSDAKARTFSNLLQARKNNWCQLEDQIVIASLRGKAKVDFTVGHMKDAPYLFTMDNHAIVRRWGKWSIGSVAKSPSPWQSFVDKAMGIIRIEPRHRLDFRALLRAIILLSQGAAWDTSPQVIADYIAPYLDNPMDDLIFQLTLKLDDPRVKRVGFIVNFLSLVPDPKMRQTIWERLKNPWFQDFDSEYEEAALQIAEQNKAFPGLFGAIPLLKIPADKTLPVPSLTFMRKTLFLELSPPDETCSGVYASWRRGCHQLQRKEKVPEELLKTLGAMYIQGLLDDESQVKLAQLLNVPSFMDALLGPCEDHEIIQQWLIQNKAHSWLDKLTSLRRNGPSLDLLVSLLNSIQDKEDFILTAFQLNLFHSTAPTQAIVKDYLLTCSNKEVVEFLNKLGPRIKAEKKDWIIELWIYAFENKKLDLDLLQSQTEKWLSSDKIPQEKKERIALTLFHRIGTASFEQVSPQHFIELFGQATLKEKENMFLWLLQNDTKAAIRFFALYEPDFRPRLHSLFDQALNSQLGHRFIALFYKEESLQDAFYDALNKIPEINRLECVRRFSQQRRLSVADNPDVLSAVDRNTLRNDLLRETKSILLLWKWQREKNSFPEKIVNMVDTAFAECKTIQVPEEEIAALLREGNFNKVARLLPKLDTETKNSVLATVRLEFAAAFENGDLRRIKQITAQALLMKVMPVPSTLKVNNNQLAELLRMIKEEKQSDLKARYCETYATQSESAAENLEFCDQLFSLLPHFPWRNHPVLFLKAATARPRELLVRFKSIESELLSIEEVPAHLSCAYFTSLYNAKMPLPSALPQKLLKELIETPDLIVNSALISILLKYNSDPEFLLFLLRKLLVLGDIDSFNEWFKIYFKHLDTNTQKSVLQIVNESSTHFNSILEISKTTPTIFGEQADEVVRYYTTQCLSQHKIVCFCCVKHLNITDLRLITPFIQETEEFDQNALNIIDYLDNLEVREPNNNLRRDFTLLLESMLKKAIAQNYCEVFEHVYDFLHKFKTTINLEPIGKMLFDRQLSNGIRDPYWLTYAESFQEIVKALKALSSPPEDTVKEDCEYVQDKLIMRAVEHFLNPAVMPEETDLDQFFHLVDGCFSRWDEQTKNHFMDNINEVIDSDAKPAQIRIRAIVFYLKHREDDDENSLCQKACELMESHFNFESFKLLFHHCMLNRPRFRATVGQLMALMDKKSETIPLDVQQFIRLFVQLEFNEKNNSEQELLGLLPIAKKMQIDLDETYVISFYIMSFFTHRLIDIAINNSGEFPKKLFEYTLKIASTLPNSSLAEAIPETLPRLVELVITNCSEENSLEYSSVLRGLNVFVKEKLLTVYKNDPKLVALVGKKIIFSAFIHPRFVATDTKNSLCFFYDLPITPQEMVMMRACLMLISANSWELPKEVIQKSLKFPVDPVTMKTVHIRCYELAVNKNSPQNFAWILGFFNLLFSTQTDLDFLKLALPTLLTLSESKAAFKKRITDVIAEHSKIKKDKVKAFMEIVENTQPKDDLDSTRPPITVHDFEELSVRLQNIKINPNTLTPQFM